MKAVANLFANEQRNFAKSNIDYYTKTTKQMPHDFKREMSLRYVTAYHDKGLKEANKILHSVSRNVTSSGLALAADDDALIQAGRSKAKDMARMWARYVSEYLQAGITPESIPSHNVTDVTLCDAA